MAEYRKPVDVLLTLGDLHENFRTINGSIIRNTGLVQNIFPI